MVVSKLHHTSPENRLLNHSLSIGAIVIYQANALVYRPQEGRAETELLTSVCQHTVHGPTMYDRGAYFLSDVIEDHGYTLPNVRQVDDDSLLTLYRRDLMEDIEYEFFDDLVAAMVQKQIAGSSHDMVVDETETQTDLLSRQAARASSRARQRYVQMELGAFEDFDSAPQSGGFFGDGIDESMWRIGMVPGLANILRRFPSDVLRIAPKPKSQDMGQAEWLCLSPMEVDVADIKVFQSPDFKPVISEAMCYAMSPSEWRDIAYERFFPMKGFTPPSNFQGYRSMKYWVLWSNLMTRTGEEDAEVIRELVYPWFSQLAWLPSPEKDRVWSTKPATGHNKWIRDPSSGTLASIPRLVINSEALANSKSSVELVEES